MDKKIIIEQERKTLNILKDFQRATVERIAYLFKNNQNRVLVADEVGLGKTLIAKGVIAKTARIRLEKGGNCFKTAYICSNQVIAKQNMSKLNIFEVNTDYSSNTRLSMQHLVIWEKKNVDTDGNNQFMQLIPLTPKTSFNLGRRRGIVGERALIYAILEKTDKVNIKKLNALFSRTVSETRWEWEKNFYKSRVEKCDENSGNKYLEDIIKRIKEYDKTHGIIKELNDYLGLNRRRQNAEKDTTIISKLRQMFAEISVEMLEPDLIIMDEFQRFKFMINNEDEVGSEMGILIDKFFKSKDNPTRVLLLSATPYKLYSTLDEIEENGQSSEHYEEFFSVINFLLDDESKKAKFKTVWEDYSNKLSEIKIGDSAILCAKEKAEDALYQTICRTERISVMDNADFIDDSSTKKSLEIEEADVQSYMQMGKLAIDTKQKLSFPVDYVKSCPYLMSYMNSYKIKEDIENYFKNNPSEVDKAEQNLLWIDKKSIDKYEELKPVNARLERLKECIFQNNAELLLWIPPSKPYYELSGVYKGTKNFSKIIVFSAWEMVPKMIGTMLSYEAERKTVGKLIRSSKVRKHTQYFVDNKQRFPVPRLRFNISRNTVKSMSLFNLIYPSETLAEMFNPIDCLNNNLSLEQIKDYLKAELTKKVKLLEKYIDPELSDRENKKWYYLAPMLLDEPKKALNWIKAVRGDSLEECGLEDELEDEGGDEKASESKDKNTL